MSLLAGCAPYQQPSSAVLQQQGLRFFKPITTWREFLYAGVVEQQYDYSCGAAAMSALLKYYFDDPVPEDEVIKDILNALKSEAHENRKEKGFSLLDLKNFAERRGYQGVGLRLSAEQLLKLTGPVLAFVSTNEYKHFLLIKGITGNRVWLADPSRGNIRMSIHQFKQEWDGIILALGKSGFQALSNHALKIPEFDVSQPEWITARKALYR
ncbi:MAG: C39 family peptidase [Pseudomonadales bacterium]